MEKIGWQIGDLIIFIEPSIATLTYGRIYEIKLNSGPYVYIIQDDGCRGGWYKNRFISLIDFMREE
jgi:hypothetical protein